MSASNLIQFPRQPDVAGVRCVFTGRLRCAVCGRSYVGHTIWTHIDAVGELPLHRLRRALRGPCSAAPIL